MNVFRYSFLHREFLVIPKVGKNRKFVGFSWVLVVIKILKRNDSLPKKINRFEGILEKTKQ